MGEGVGSTRRYLLKPLLSGGSAAPDESAIDEALERVERRVDTEGLLSEVVIRSERYLADPAEADAPEDVKARRHLLLVRALYSSRRLTLAEYVYHACHYVMRIHEDRWFEGAYDSELDPISDQLKAIEAEHGLTENEFWMRGEGPRQHRKLNGLYERTLDLKAAETLREFGFDELADMFEHDRAEYDRLNERGRRAVFHAHEYTAALRDVVARYEAEAETAARGGAYSAANTALGAAVEGMLLLRCIRSPKKAARFAARLPRKQRPNSPSEPSSWTFAQLIEVCLAAGWLPAIETAYAAYSPAGMAHLIRHLRNNVHPAKVARLRPWTETDEREYRDTKAFYVLLKASLSGRSKRVGRPCSTDQR